MGRWKGALYAGRDDMGVNDASLAKRVAGLEDQLEGEGPGGGSGTVEPCAPNFILGYQRLKRRVRPNPCANVPTGTARLITRVIRASDRTSAASFDQLQLGSRNELDESQSAAGHVEYIFNTPLEYATTYHLTRLIAVAPDGTRSFYPLTEPEFNTPVPAAHIFTTPEQFNVPSAPSAADILVNELDPTTPEWDARVLVRMHAPLTDVGGNQSFGAALVEEVVVVFTRNGVNHKFGHLLTSAEQSQVDGSGRGFVDVMCSNLAPGATYIWTANIAWTNGEKRTASGSVSFVAGNLNINPALLLTPSLVASGIEPFDGRITKVTFTATQPSIPVALRNIRLNIKRSSQDDSFYENIGDGTLQGLRSGENHVPSTPIVPVVWTVPTKPSRSYTARARLRTMGGLTQDYFSTFTPGDMVIPARNYQFSAINLVFNGGFLLSLANTDAGNAEVLARQWRVAAGTANTRIDTLSGPANTFIANGVGWDKPTHRLQFSSSFAPTAAVKVRKQIIPGETYALTLLISSFGTYINFSFTVDLFDVGSSAVIVSQVIPTLTITSAYEMIIAILQVPGTYVPSGTQWLRLQFVSPPANTTFIDNVMLVRGQQGLPWSPSPDEADFDHSIGGISDSGAGAVGGKGGGHNTSDIGEEFTVDGTRAGVLISPGAV